MSMTTFVSDGAAIDFTPATDVAPGSVVVQGDLVGVASRPIPANTTGGLAVTGIFDFPKAKGLGMAIAVGVLVYWHVDIQIANTTADGGKPIGKTVRAAADADETVRTRLSQ